MDIFELFLIAVGLSMDAFAVAICKGMSLRRSGFLDALTVGLYFGFFQAAMPLAGFLLGSNFREMIEKFDHWIAFGLLLLIGINMLRESFEHARCCSPEKVKPNASSLGFGVMLMLALATSIDALTVGITFAFLQVQILPAIAIIGIITLFISISGVYIGRRFGNRFQAKAELVGGILLILIGVKVLLEHLGILAF
ncbi:MAG: manganese efflux pump MntP family protein [Bacillota bacterium]